jgi:hypothetical protein
VSNDEERLEEQRLEEQRKLLRSLTQEDRDFIARFGFEKWQRYKQTS